MGVDRCVKCPSLLSDFSKNWDMLTNFSKPHRYHIDGFRSAVLELFQAWNRGPGGAVLFNRLSVEMRRRQ